MKLIYKIISRLSLALLVLMAGWAVAFYFIITDEINDETDDTLENYAHYLITRVLAGEELPSSDNGTNNTFYIKEVDEQYAAENPAFRYADEMVYIYSKMETEPARVLKTIFRDSADRIHELTVAIPSYEKQDLQSRILWWLVILYAVLLAGVIAVNTWIVRRSFRPLYVLLDWLGTFKLGDAVPQLDNETDITEFSRLNDTMVLTARHNKEMFDEQRIFIGNAAHELQTPVAVCRGRLELLAADPSLGEAQLEKIGSVMHTLDHLSRLNRTLLLLTKIENRQFPDNADIDINGLVRRLIWDYDEVYAYRSLKARLRDEGRLTARMNETLASVLLNNLIKNAFIYSPEGGTVAVTVTGGSVSVSNAVTGGPLDPAVIFRRFYRGENREGSAGLGLALVESICRLYGLAVSYDFADGRHIFTVTFPVK